MKIKLFGVMASMFLLVACDKSLELDGAPNFSVQTEAKTYKVGEEVKFNFTGKADLISYYSGESLNDYDYKDSRVIDLKGGGATLSFSSAVTLGAQANQLRVLASTDFNGDYSNLETVKAADWVDITNRFVYGTNATFRASGTIDISDLLLEGKPIYIAFKYLTKPQKDNGLARTWMIQGFDVSSKKKLGETPIPIVGQITSGFRIVDQYPVDAPARSLVSPTRITLYGNVYKYAESPLFDPENPIFDRTNPNYDPSVKYVPFDPSSPFNDPESENWAVSTPIFTEKIDLGPDRAIAVKGIDTQTNGTTITHVYSTPGIYKAVFVGYNSNVSESKQVVRSIEITIEP